MEENDDKLIWSWVKLKDKIIHSGDKSFNLYTIFWFVLRMQINSIDMTGLEYFWTLCNARYENLNKNPLKIINVADFKVTAPHNNRQLQAEGHLCMSFKQGLVSKPVTNYISNIIKANSKILYNAMNFIQFYGYNYFQAQFSQKAANHSHPFRHTHTRAHAHTHRHTHTQP